MMFDYSVRFEAIDTISAKINKINSRMAQMGNKAKQASSKIQSSFNNMRLTSEFKIRTQKALAKVRKLTNKIKNAKDEIQSFGLKSAVAGGAVLAGIGVMVNSARKYELAFKDVKKAVDGTPEQLRRLRDEMKSFRGASFEELSAVTAEAGKMGFNADKVMAFTKSVTMGAKALDFSAELAVGQIGKILSLTNQMKNSVEAGADIMDKVVNLENNLAGVKGAGVIDIWKRNADIYANLNFENESMGAMSGFLEQVSTSSELGASSFKIMINRFTAMEEELGFINRIKTGGLEGLKDVMQKISLMTPEQQIKKFGSEAMSLIRKLQSEKNIAKLDFALEISKQSQGAVLKEWELFRATFDESINDMNKNMANMGDSIGTIFVPAIRFLADLFGRISDGISSFTAEHPKLAKVIGITIAILGVLGVVAGIVAIAMFAISLPVLAVIAGVTLLIGAVVALIVYWKDLTMWVSTLWEKFTGFISSLGIVETAINGVKNAFSVLTAPIRYAINLIDTFLSKFELFNKAKQKVADVAGVVSETASSAFEGAKDFFGFGEDEKKSAGTQINNTQKNHTVVDVNVTAVGGASADTSSRSTGAVKLKTVNNGL